MERAVLHLADICWMFRETARSSFRQASHTPLPKAAGRVSTPMFLAHLADQSARIIRFEHLIDRLAWLGRCEPSLHSSQLAGFLAQGETV